MRGLISFCLLLCLLCSAQQLPKKTKLGRAPAPPPQGTIVGNTITKNAGQQVVESLGVANLCGGDKFIITNGGPIIYWEGQWEFGYMLGREDREIFGRHTYAKAGVYKVTIRIDAKCKGRYEGYDDVVAGQATVVVN
jgi:hypothetical protein